MRFTTQGTEYDLNQVYPAVGYPSMAPVTDLSDVHIVRYDASTRIVDESSNLVVDGGTFNGTSAQLKTLAVGSNMSLTESNGTVTLDATGFAPASLTKQSILDSIQVDASTMLVDRTTPDSVIISSLVNQNDLFNDILVGPGLVATRDTTNNQITLNTASTVLTETTGDSRYAPIAGAGSTVEAIKQAVLDAISLGTAQLTLDRSVPGTLTINAPPFSYSWPQGTVYNYSNASGDLTFDPNQTTVSGGKLPIQPGSVPSNFELSFEMLPSGNTTSSQYIFYFTDTAGNKGHSFYGLLYNNVSLYDLYGIVSSEHHATYTDNFVSVKLVQNSSGAQLYIDNVVKSSLSSSQFNDRRDCIYIGSYKTGTGYSFNGQIRNLQIIET